MGERFSRFLKRFRNPGDLYEIGGVLSFQKCRYMSKIALALTGSLHYGMARMACIFTEMQGFVNKKPFSDMNAAL